MSLNDIVNTIKQIPTDSAFQIIDQQSNFLDSTNASVDSKLELLNLKADIADSVGNNMVLHFTYQKLLSYSNNIPIIEQCYLLKKDGDLQNGFGNIDEAMNSYFNVVAIADSIQNDSLLADIYRTIGIRYKNSFNPKLALKYLDQSLVIFTKMGDSIGIINCFMTMGNAFKQQEIYDSAHYYYTKSIFISDAKNYDRGLAGNYNNIGSAFLLQDSLKKALEYFFLALEINAREENERWVSYNYNYIGDAYLKQKKYPESITYYKKSLAIKNKLGDIQNKIQTLASIGEVYAIIGDYNKAYSYLKEHIEIKSNFHDEQRLKMADELESRFQNEKKESEILTLITEQSLQKVVIDGQKKDLAHQDELRNKEKKLIYALGFILLSLLIAVFFFWRNNRQRKKYTEELTIKNSKIEQVSLEINRAHANLAFKNKEITDSIIYAKRIQAAILPSKKTLASHLNQAFVMYLPKDIVAGDFYWTEQVGNTILFAVADCTGHGVPGAMVSVICHNALNSCIKQLGLTDPGEILDETTKRVVKQFEKSEDEVQDGMDIALCSFNTKSRELKFAGANTPMWIVRGQEILKYRATRQPVGNYTKRVQFESSVIPIIKGDIIYLSSDGYTDQFGGEKGKKYLNKRFRELLINISKKNINEQAGILQTNFLKWKGEFEQVDDVCLMGVRVEQ